MERFKKYLLNESYNFRPRSLSDLDGLKYEKELKEIYQYIKLNYPEIEYPLAIDPKTGKAKIKRDLMKASYNDKTLVSFLDYKSIVGFGNGSSNKNRQSMMSQIEDFGEITTIMAITKKIEKPEDSEQEFFIKNPDVFYDWMNTFVETRKAIEQILKYSKNEYLYLHDARDKSEFHKTIKRFLQKSGMNKHNWNPADLWIIHKRKFDKIINDLNKIIKEADGNILINSFNLKIYELFNEGLLYPISLKKIKSSYKIEYSNIPGDDLKYSPVKIDYFINNFKLDTKEIGSFRFINLDTGNPITMQHNQQPPGYSTTQTEITNDGTKTAGKIGKVPAFFVSNIMEEYGHFRIETTKYFGTKKDKFANFDKKKREYHKKQYRYVYKDKRVKSSVSIKEFEKMIDNVEMLNSQEADNFISKIQGLNMQYFFLKNEKDITRIINDMIFAAKKIGKINSFFVKIF